MRFTTQQNGEHHVAIPDHSPLQALEAQKALQPNADAVLVLELPPKTTIIARINVMSEVLTFIVFSLIWLAQFSSTARLITLLNCCVIVRRDGPVDRHPPLTIFMSKPTLRCVCLVSVVPTVLKLV